RAGAEARGQRACAADGRRARPRGARWRDPRDAEPMRPLPCPYPASSTQLRDAPVARDRLLSSGPRLRNERRRPRESVAWARDIRPAGRGLPGTWWPLLPGAPSPRRRALDMTPVRTALNLFAFVVFVALWAGFTYAF